MLSGCSTLANAILIARHPVSYLHRHDQAAKIIHQELVPMYCLLEQRMPYYRCYTATRWTPVLLGPITTHRTILTNMADIVMMDRTQSRVFLVEITTPHDENNVEGETEKNPA